MDIIARAQESPGHQAPPRQPAVIAGPLAQPRTVDGPRLALQDHAVDRTEFGQGRQTDIADLGAKSLKRAAHVFQRGRHLRIGRHVGCVEVPDKADTQPSDAAFQRRRVKAVARRDAAWVKRIVAGDDAHHRGAVVDVAGEGPDVVEAGGEGDEAVAAHPAVGWLEADRPGERRRLADRAPRVGAGDARRDSRCDRRS